MKNGFLSLRLWVMLCLFVGSTFSLQAQCSIDGVMSNLIKICSNDIGTGGSNPLPPTGCTSQSIPVYLNNECEGYVNINVYLTNLVSNPVKDVVYTLPSSYPPIYIRHEYSEGNWQVTGPYTEFTYHGQVAGNAPGLYDLYYAPASLPTARTSNTGCSEAQTPTLDYFDMTIEIVTIDGQGYDLYPIGDYATASDIFSCSLFDETDCLCERNPCANADDPTFEVEVCIDCGTCRDYLDPSDTDGDRSAAIEKGSFENVQVSPNPFQDVIELFFTTNTAGPLTWEIYDARGALLQSQQQNFAAGQHSQSINTDQLPVGIYYLQIRNEEMQVSQKVIKTP